MRSNRQRELINALPQRESARIEELRFDVRQNGYWDLVNGQFYGDASSVNALIPKSGWPVKLVIQDDGKAKETFVKPAAWLAAAENECIVNDSIWLPGQPNLVEGFMIKDNGSVVASGQRNLLFNTYSPPPVPPKTKQKPDSWLDHVKALWPIEDEHNFFFDYCAHMIQRPEEKANSVITLSGEQGIGKDVALDPVKAAIGPWNAQNITPQQFMGNYNSWAQTVMLVIDEMRPPTDDYHASSIYDKLKSISVTPPDMIAVSEKYLKLRYVRNVMRVFVTTNEMTAMYIHPNDRRFAIFHSSLKSRWQPQSYFASLKLWMERGGNAAVARWLLTRDISKFEPKRRPIETAGWRAIVGGWAAPDDAIAQALDRLNNPQVFFPPELLPDAISDDRDEVEKMLRSPRRLTHRMQSSNYFLVPFDPPVEYVGEKKLRFKSAYVKYDLLNSKEVFEALLAERGNLLAGSNVVPLKKEGVR